MIKAGQFPHKKVILSFIISKISSDQFWENAVISFIKGKLF